MLLLLVVGTQAIAAEPTAANASPERLSGYNCVFMGHSFFAPIAVGIDAHAKRAGFATHRQQVFFAGGSKGTPGWLWRSEDHRKRIQAALASGKVDLLGMTYTTQNSELKDFKQWVDFALNHNPKTRFFIARPWIPYPKSVGTKQYARVYASSMEPINGIIDRLRKDYPKSVFFSINYGQSAVELRRLYDAGKLPEVNALLTNNREGKIGIYRDQLGHADRGNRLLISLSELVWLSTIYQVDLKKYQWMPICKADLKAIAAKIVSEDPYCQVGPRPPRPTPEPSASREGAATPMSP